MKQDTMAGQPLDKFTATMRSMIHAWQIYVPPQGTHIHYHADSWRHATGTRISPYLSIAVSCTRENISETTLFYGTCRVYDSILGPFSLDMRL